MDSEALSFDRAAGYYDATRSISREAMTATVAMLVAETARAAGAWRSGAGPG